jgi:DNA repair photolyase
MDLVEITVKSALTRSKIPGVEYVINPYIGCGHGCRYCYAAFMGKWSKCHAKSKWGTFVEAKINIGEILHDELSRKRRRGTALLSSVCDPYQPVEERFELTRKCVTLLQQFGWGIEILTRSPLVTRDIGLFNSNVSVGISIPTDDDMVRQALEPNSPSIGDRVKALRKLHEAVETWAFIAPMLPMNPQNLHEAIEPYVSYVLIDKLNYSEKVQFLFHEKGWDYALTDKYAMETESKLIAFFKGKAKGV